jgi:hypothetical protein
MCNHKTSWYEEAIAHAGLHSQRNKQTEVNKTILVFEHLILRICEGAEVKHM